MSFGYLIAMAAAVWLLSCAASVFGLGWNLISARGRLLPAFIGSGVGLGIATFGLMNIQLKASKTVNGHVEYSLNSRWFFIAALVLAGVSLGVTFWNWRRATRGITVPDI